MMTYRDNPVTYFYFIDKCFNLTGVSSRSSIINTTLFIEHFAITFEFLTCNV